MEVLMPLHVNIKINDRSINAIHIGRVSGNTDPDSINHYLAVAGEEPLFKGDWVERGTHFTHRYGDGAEICVAKGLEALYGKQD
jgi:hypothetical protein